ncbi:hypothetical protein HK104_005595, partial [Borealophlyctis nickersoniae]
KKGKGGKTKKSNVLRRIPGLVLPSRLKLATFRGPGGGGSAGQKREGASPPAKSSTKVNRKERRERRKEKKKDVAGTPEKQSESGAAAGAAGVAQEAKPVRQSTANPAAPGTAQGKGRRKRSKDPQSVGRHRVKFALEATQYDSVGARQSLAALSAEVREAKFEEMGLTSDLLNAVKALGLRRPREVQALVVPKAIQHPTTPILCAAETGSGKTLAYLLPLFHHLKEQERVALEESKKAGESSTQMLDALLPDGSAVSSTDGLSQLRRLRRPRAVVIVPSRELVLQVTAVAKEISHHARIRVLGLHARTEMKRIKASLESPVDLLITTPGALLKFIDMNLIGLSETRHIAIDEADTMFDEGFGQELSSIFETVKRISETRSRPCQFIFVSATLPRSVVRTLNRDFPDTIRITTPFLHRTLPKLHQVFLRIDSSTTKKNMLLDILKRAVADDDRIIIFCNTRKTCAEVTAFLKEKRYLVADVSSQVETKERAIILEEFVGKEVKGKTGKTKEGSPETKKEPTPSTPEDPAARLPPLLLVATDIASRGIDTTRVGHVILYDFPQTAIDYLHRVGRTARNGGKGRATSIVGRKDRRLAEEIEYAVKRRMVLT